MLATLPLGLLALGAAGAWFYLAQRQYLQQVASANLLAVAQAKLDQIVAWRTKSLGDAALLQEDPFFVRAVARWLAGHQPGIAADILTRLRSASDELGYDDARLVDREGRVVLATRGRQGVLDAEEAAAVRSAFRGRRPTIGDVHVSSDDSFPHLTLVAPLFAPSGRVAGPIGAVVHTADPRRSLFRLVESWQGRSPNAEVNLVRRDGDSVLFLTARRLQPGAALTLRISLSRRDLPAVMAVLGTEGVVRGVDYRGLRVLAALRAVPGTPWFLVAKVDEAEALAVWRTRVALVFAVFLGLVLVAAATAVAIDQRLAKARYRRLYEAEAALGASEARFRTQMEEAGDGFALLDAEGRYLDVNTECCQQLGYAREELLRLRISDIDSLFSPQQFAADFQALVGKRPVTYESEHRRKDATTFPVEVTLSIALSGGVPQALALVRDVSERKRAVEALRHEQAMLARTEGNAHIGSWEWDITPDTVVWSDELFRIFQRDPREGAPSFAEHPAFYHPDDMARLQQAVEVAVAEGTPYELELRAIRKDGETRMCVARGMAERSPGGRVVRLCGSLQDITERKRAEEALARTLGELNAVLDATAEGILVVDEAGRVLLVNARFREMWRIPDAVAASRDDGVLLDFVLDQLPDPEGFLAKVESLYRQDVEDSDTLAFKDGRVFERFSCPLIEGGHPVARLWSFRDITERKRAEETLRESEERHRNIIEQLNDVYYRTDRDGRITMVSPSAAQLYGFPSTGEMIGRPIESLWQNPDQRATMLAAIDESGFVRDFETSAVRTDGTPFTVAVSSHYLRDASGAPDGVEGIIRNITERKRAEAALRALARHLDSVREEEHTRIARQVHDELGQALTALRLDLTWVGRKLPKGNTALRRRIDAALALTDETITVGQRIVEELRPPILDDLGLVPAVEWYAQHFAKRSGLRIELDVGAKEPVVPNRLAVTAYRIVQEALANVARHAQATHARVRLRERDGALTIEIRDDGQGFPEEAIRSPRSFGIVGMRERATSQGGALVITSSPGAGTTVQVTFPPERRKGPRVPR
jgi:PAS domain S-box-containing protein